MIHRKIERLDAGLLRNVCCIGESKRLGHSDSNAAHQRMTKQGDEQLRGGVPSP